ncbi:MAG: hypothetical protein II304_07815 [Bacteroidales bacterium]|jgi:hypothetical protein|nr:hypothetical protein [Bacteroidales bacterium]
MISQLIKKRRYTEEVERVISYYTELNKHQPVYTYYLTAEEMAKKIAEMVKPVSDCHRLKPQGA